mgnify:CR=1 FL=1
MLDCLPERVEPLGLADVGRSFRGNLPVQGFERLAPLLQSNEGELAVTVAIAKKIGTNGVTVANEVLERIEALKLNEPLHLEIERVMLGYLVALLEKRLQSVDFIRRLRLNHVE